jgi:16S rRNA (cytidine1402-2'-O)-methyltransferase
MADISERAVETLRNADIVACEDTRSAGRILSKFGIEKKMVVYEDSREARVAPALLDELKSGKSIALVSDAGMPSISDPGFRLVRLCRKEGVGVLPVPGPTAFTAALAASGLPSHGFLFAGFLPAKTSARKNFFEKYKSFEFTLCLYESTHRIEKFMDDLVEVLGQHRYVCVAKEITKLHERFFIGRADEVRAELASSNTKGEFAVIIAPDGYEI